jgi:hypothetical protein
MSIEITNTVKNKGMKKVKRYQLLFFPTRRLTDSLNIESRIHLINLSAADLMLFSIGDLENPAYARYRPNKNKLNGNRRVSHVPFEGYK